MYRILHPTNIESAWPTIEPWIRKALDDTSAEVDIEQIKLDARAGRNMVLLGYDPDTKDLDLVLIGEAQKYGGIETFVIMWAAGKNMHSWIKDIAIVEKFAKSRGFLQIQIWGRKGFEKTLKAEGYRHEFTVIGKPLNFEVH